MPRPPSASDRYEQQEAEATPRMQTLTSRLTHSVTVFRPDDGGERLYAQADETLSAGPGEGAVGRAWAEGLPIVERSSDRQATLAIPSIRGDECRGVVALHCAAEDELRGAIEVWRRNERGELGIHDAWCPGLERLEQVTRFIKFPRPAGLPGRVWEDRFPRVLGGLEESKHFVRVAAARSERLNSALGLPFMAKPPELDAVLLLLNTQATPLARVMEVWARDLETGRLKIISADYGTNTDLAAASRSLTLHLGDGIAGHVWRDVVPWATTDLLGVEFPRGDQFANDGFESGVGMPVFIGTDLVACVNLYF